MLAPFFSALFVSGIVTHARKNTFIPFQKRDFHSAVPNKISKALLREGEFNEPASFRMKRNKCVFSSVVDDEFGNKRKGDKGIKVFFSGLRTQI